MPVPLPVPIPVRRFRRTRPAGPLRALASRSLFLGALGLLSALAVTARASYEIVGLGTLGGLSTEAVGVNDARQVAGSLTGT